MRLAELWGVRDIKMSREIAYKMQLLSLRFAYNYWGDRKQLNMFRSAKYPPRNYDDMNNGLRDTKSLALWTAKNMFTENI